jgi:8-oxo-dGTP diphosphatase
MHTHIAVLALLERGKNILFLKRSPHVSFAPGTFTLLSGSVEPGESVRLAVVREVKEETGITINPNDLSFVHVMHRQKENGDVWVDFFFQTKKWEGEPYIAEPDKFDDLQWFSLDKLPDNILPFLRICLKDIQERKPYSDFGWEH